MGIYSVITDMFQSEKILVRHGDQKGSSSNFLRKFVLSAPICLKTIRKYYIKYRLVKFSLFERKFDFSTKNFRKFKNLYDFLCHEYVNIGYRIILTSEIASSLQCAL